MALGSLVDNPLQQNPLAGGGFGGALEAPAPTYDELQGDALVKQIQGRMMQQDVKSPAWNAFASEVMKTKGYPTKTMQEYNTLFPNNLLTQNPLLDAGSNANFNVSPPGTLKLDPQADMPDTLGPQIIDPNAEAQKKAKVEPESPNPFTPPTPTIPTLDGTRSVSPIYSGDNSIATTQTVPTSPYQEQFTGFNDQLTGFGDQLTGFGDQFGGFGKQFDTINTRLNSMDEGIASLNEQLQPQQKLYNSPYSNFNFSTNSYSNPSPFGLGSLFGRRY